MLPGLGGIVVGSSAPDNIVFVGGAVADFAGSAATSRTLALNSGLTGGIASSASSGDFVIAVFATGSNTDRTLAITDGTDPYELIGSEMYVDGSAFDVNLRVAFKRITADTQVTFGPTGSDNDAGCYAVYVFRNVDTVTPIDVAVTIATGTDSDVDPASITPNSQNTFLVVIGAGGEVEEVGNFTSSELTDFLATSSNDLYDCILGIGHVPSWPGGAFNPAAFGNSNVNAWAAMTIALRSA